MFYVWKALNYYVWKCGVSNRDQISSLCVWILMCVQGGFHWCMLIYWVCWCVDSRLYTILSQSLSVCVCVCIIVYVKLCVCVCVCVCEYSWLALPCLSRCGGVRMCSSACETPTQQPLHPPPTHGKLRLFWVGLCRVPASLSRGRYGTALGLGLDNEVQTSGSKYCHTTKPLMFFLSTISVITLTGCASERQGKPQLLGVVKQSLQKLRRRIAILPGQHFGSQFWLNV